MKSRRWLWPLGFAIVALLGSMFFTLLSNVEPSSRMVVRSSDPAGAQWHPINKRLWVSRTTSKAPTGIWLVPDGESWRAFSDQTPHPLGCTFGWDVIGMQFVEPCLGQIFDRDGVNVAGPAPRGLDQYPVSLTEHGSIEIDLSKPTPAKR